MTKQDALDLIEQKMQKVNLKKHCWGVGMCMGGLFDYFSSRHPELVSGFTRDDWEIVGLMHDADYEQTVDDPQHHTEIAGGWMKEKGAREELIRAIRAHNYSHGQTDYEPNNILEWALVCADDLSGLIVATALVMPSKTLAEVTVDSVLKKMKDKSFAAGVHREKISQCEQELAIELEEFIKICLNAMQQNAALLGL